MTFRYGETVHKKGAQARDYSFLGVLLGWLLFTASPPLPAEFDDRATSIDYFDSKECVSFSIRKWLGPTVGERRAANSEQRVRAEISKTGLDEILYSRL